MNLTHDDEARETLLDEANRSVQGAMRITDPALRSSMLRKAADRFRAADRVGMAQWCERFIN
jgi:hypothetical protein